MFAVDVGQVTAESAGQWLSGTMMGAVSEYVRRSAKERSAEGQARAVARGATPWARVPLGYTRRENGTLEPDLQRVAIVERAFEMRGSGSSIPEIQNMLKSCGVDRSQGGVQVLLKSRVYLGEIHFGKMVNLHAHEPIVNRDLWKRVQRMAIPRRRRPSSDRLLARLGVLRCGSCDSRLSPAAMARAYPVYRCSSTNDCEDHVVISAKIAEDVVTSAVRAALADAEGRASMAESAQQAALALGRAQAVLDAALQSFGAAGLENEQAAVDRLAELRQVRDDAQAHVDQIGPEAGRRVNAAADWDELSLAGRRELIRATVKIATVAPRGRGPSRIKVRLLGE